MSARDTDEPPSSIMQTKHTACGKRARVPIFTTRSRSRHNNPANVSFEYLRFPETVELRDSRWVGGVRGKIAKKTHRSSGGKSADRKNRDCIYSSRPSNEFSLTVRWSSDTPHLVSTSNAAIPHRKT